MIPIVTTNNPMLTSNCTMPVDLDPNDYYFDDIHNTISFRRPAKANALAPRSVSRLHFSDTESDDDDESLSSALTFAIDASKEAIGSPLRGSLGGFSTPELKKSPSTGLEAYEDERYVPKSELKKLALEAALEEAIVPIAVIVPCKIVKIVKTRMTTRSKTTKTTTRFFRDEGGSLRNGVCFMKD